VNTFVQLSDSMSATAEVLVMPLSVIMYWQSVSGSVPCASQVYVPELCDVDERHIRVCSC